MHRFFGGSPKKLAKFFDLATSWDFFLPWPFNSCFQVNWDVLLVLRINGLFHPFIFVGWIRPASRWNKPTCKGSWIDHFHVHIPEGCGIWFREVCLATSFISGSWVLFLKPQKKRKSKQWSLNGTHFGGLKQYKYMDIYGNFEGFPLLWCIVWVGNSSSPWHPHILVGSSQNRVGFHV